MNWHLRTSEPRALLPLTPVATSSARCCPLTMACTAVSQVHMPMEAASALPLPQGICANGMAASGCQSGRASMPCSVRVRWGMAVEGGVGGVEQLGNLLASCSMWQPQPTAAQTASMHRARDSAGGDPQAATCPLLDSCTWVDLPATLRTWCRHLQHSMASRRAGQLASGAMAGMYVHMAVGSRTRGSNHTARQADQRL